MDAQQNLIAEYMTKLTERLDEIGEQSPIVNFFLMEKDEQLGAFKAWIGQKNQDLTDEKIAVQAHVDIQMSEIDDKVAAADVITKGGKLPDPIIVEVPVVDDPLTPEVIDG